ncbi:MAG: hypothetical protein QE271_01015 [Bacteriovoracaceae bacterium]|nr:hypothetical protein [Bacteriovoracaceae bacterium]
MNRLKLTLLATITAFELLAHAPQLLAQNRSSASACFDEQFLKSGKSFDLKERLGSLENLLDPTTKILNCDVYDDYSFNDNLCYFHFPYYDDIAAFTDQKVYFDTKDGKNPIESKPGIGEFTTTKKFVFSHSITQQNNLSEYFGPDVQTSKRYLIFSPTDDFVMMNTYDKNMVDHKHIYTYKKFPCKNVYNPQKILKDVFPNFKIFNSETSFKIISVTESEVTLKDLLTKELITISRNALVKLNLNAQDSNSYKFPEEISSQKNNSAKDYEKLPGKYDCYKSTDGKLVFAYHTQIKKIASQRRYQVQFLYHKGKATEHYRDYKFNEIVYEYIAGAVLGAWNENTSVCGRANDQYSYIEFIQKSDFKDPDLQFLNDKSKTSVAFEVRGFCTNDVKTSGDAVCFKN